MSTSTSSGFFGTVPAPEAPSKTAGFRGGPPIIDSNTCTGSGTFGGAPPGGRLRPEPLGIRAVAGRLVFEEAGDMRDREEERGFRPGRGGRGPGPEGYGLRGAGEYESRRGGGVPDGVGWAVSLSRPHMMLQNAVSPRSSAARCSAADKVDWRARAGTFTAGGSGSTADGTSFVRPDARQGPR